LLPFNEGPAGGYPGADAQQTAVISAVREDGLPVGDAPTMVHNGPLVRDEFDDYDNFARNYGTSHYKPGGASPQSAAETQQYGGQQYGGGAPQQYGGGPRYDEATRAWQSGGDQPAHPVSGGAVPTSGAGPVSGPPGIPEPTSGQPGGRLNEVTQPWQQPDTSRPAGTTYGGTMYGRGPGSPGAAPTSGAAVTPPPPPPPAPTSGGPGYLTPGGTYGTTPGLSGGGPSTDPAPRPSSGAPVSGGATDPRAGYPASPAGQYGGPAYGPGADPIRGGEYPAPSAPPQQEPQRDVNDATRVWQQQRQNPAPYDETRLDRADGVDWLDG
jgi:hypothetical protein